MNEPNETSVERADNVGHADNVTSAEHVGLARTLEVHSNGTSYHENRIKQISDLTKNIIVIIALAVMIFNFVDKQSADRTVQRERTELRAQLQAVNDQLAAADQQAAERTLCARKHQDNVDKYTTETLVTIGELVVIITQIVPGPEREMAVTDKIAQLQAAISQVRAAIVAKGTYNDEGNPLPCPI